MGLTNKNETQEATSHHFSHPHPLQLINHQPQQALNLPISCPVCNLQASGSIYTCTSCPFFLHQKCFDLPKNLTHPSHKSHPLTFLPKSPYPNGIFTCDGCGENGNGSSYHCEPCHMDLHVLCAILPLSLTHFSHQHKLELTFQDPYGVMSYLCDICKTNGSNHWLYRCKYCGFDAHLMCVSRPPQLQQQPGLQQSNFMSFANIANQPPSLQQPALQQSNFTSFTNIANQPPSQQQYNLTSFMSHLNQTPFMQQQASQQFDCTSFMSRLNQQQQQFNMTSFNPNNFQYRTTSTTQFGPQFKPPSAD